jgi:hypothetical protein
MSLTYSPAVDDVMSAINYLGQQGAAVELKKTFAGLLLQQEIRVLEVNPEDAAFQLTNIEMSAALEGDVFLHSRLFPKPVKARVKSLDIGKCILVLSGFVYIENGLEKRQYERVRPKHSTYATLHCRGKTQRVCIDNISVNGMGIYAFKLFERGMKLRPGSRIQLEFRLSPDQNNMVLNGKIVYINALDRYSTTMGIRLLPKARQSRMLSEYIAPRKQEILEELSQAYWELVKPRGVESLYF